MRGRGELTPRPVGAGVARGGPWGRPAGTSVRVKRTLPLQPGSAPGPVPRREGGGRARGARRAAAARRRKPSPSPETRKRARSFRASRCSAVPCRLSKYAWPLFLPFSPLVASGQRRRFHFQIWKAAGNHLLCLSQCMLCLVTPVSRNPVLRTERYQYLTRRAGE